MPVVCRDRGNMGCGLLNILTRLLVARVEEVLPYTRRSWHVRRKVVGLYRDKVEGSKWRTGIQGYICLEKSAMR